MKLMDCSLLRRINCTLVANTERKQADRQTYGDKDRETQRETKRQQRDRDISGVP